MKFSKSKIKNEILKNGYFGGISDPSNLLKYITSFSPTEKELCQINDDFLIERCLNEQKMLSNKLIVSDFLPNEKFLWELMTYSSLKYLPGIEASSAIASFFIESNNCYIINWKDIDGLNENDTLWDLFVISSDYLNDSFDMCRYFSFSCSMLNDSCYFNCDGFYHILEDCPYKTGKRFSGFLAHLFYSGNMKIYNDFFSFLFETINRHFENVMPLPLFLYNFCLENDSEKAELVLKLINENVQKSQSFDWNKPLKECFHHPHIEKFVVGNPNIKLKEIIDFTESK